MRSMFAMFAGATLLVSGCGGHTVTSENDGSGRSSATGAPGGAGSSGAAGGAAVATTTTCPAPPVKSDFENGIDPAWHVTDESAFRIDEEHPLDGAKSLRVAYRQKASYLTITMPSVCEIKLTMTIRADAQFLTSEATLARIAVGSDTWFHLRLGGSGLTLAQETRSATAAGLGVGGVLGKIAADTPTTIVVSVDVRTKTASAVLAPVGQALPQASPTAIHVDETNPPSPGPITTIDLGAAPGIQSSALGIVWIDDVSVD